jgi:hypothetical protein
MELVRFVVGEVAKGPDRGSLSNRDRIGLFVSGLDRPPPKLIADQYMSTFTRLVRLTVYGTRSGVASYVEGALHSEDPVAERFVV